MQGRPGCLVKVQRLSAARSGARGAAVGHNDKRGRREAACVIGGCAEGVDLEAGAAAALRRGLQTEEGSGGSGAALERAAVRQRCGAEAAAGR